MGEAGPDHPWRTHPVRVISPVRVDTPAPHTSVPELTASPPGYSAKLDLDHDVEVSLGDPFNRASGPARLARPGSLIPSSRKMATTVQPSRPAAFCKGASWSRPTGRDHWCYFLKAARLVDVAMLPRIAWRYGVCARDSTDLERCRPGPPHALAR